MLAATRLGSAPEREAPCALMARFRSSATAARIAPVIFTISAILAAGLRSRAAPISSTNIFSVASIASEARSIAVFMAFVYEARGSLSRRNYQHRLNPVVAVRLAAPIMPATERRPWRALLAQEPQRTIFRDGG